MISRPTPQFRSTRLRSCPLKGLDAGKFAARAAHYMGELSAIHAFREGNGRAQREFIRLLAQVAGHTLDWHRVKTEQLHEASRLSFQRGDNSRLETIIRDALGDKREKVAHRSADTQERVRKRIAALKRQQDEHDKDRGGREG